MRHSATRCSDDGYYVIGVFFPINIYARAHKSNGNACQPASDGILIVSQIAHIEMQNAHAEYYIIKYNVVRF